MTSALGFKARVDFSLARFLACALFLRNSDSGSALTRNSSMRLCLCFNLIIYQLAKMDGKMRVKLCLHMTFASACAFGSAFL